MKLKNKADMNLVEREYEEMFKSFYQLLPPPHHQLHQELQEDEPLSREDQELNQESLSYDELEES